MNESSTSLLKLSPRRRGSTIPLEVFQIEGNPPIRFSSRAHVKEIAQAMLAWVESCTHVSDLPKTSDSCPECGMSGPAMAAQAARLSGRD